MKAKLDPLVAPIMRAKCATCPFGPNGDQAVRGSVEGRVLNHASQICHHPRIHGKKETHLCRGARDVQLQVMHRAGVIDEPSDEAWERAIQAHPVLGPLARRRRAAKANRGRKPAAG